MGPINLDLFAKRLNAQVKDYVSWKLDPMAVATDAFMKKMDGQASLCLPSILSNTEMSSQSRERRGELIIVTPSWQTQAFYPVLLNMTVGDPILLPPKDNLLLSQEGKTLPLKVNKTLKSVVWKISSDQRKCKAYQKTLQDYLPQLGAKGHNQLITAACDAGVAGVIKKQIDPFCASVEQIANFLTYLFEKGHEYRTINSYRSAISGFHPEHEGIMVGQTILIKHLMAGVFNSRPPIPRYTKTWDIDLVLKYIMNLPEDKDLCGGVKEAYEQFSVFF